MPWLLNTSTVKADQEHREKVNTFTASTTGSDEGMNSCEVRAALRGPTKKARRWAPEEVRSLPSLKPIDSLSANAAAAAAAPLLLLLPPPPLPPLLPP